jgi:hypothetical protein
VKDKLGRRFRVFFDLLPVPTFILEYREGDFYLVDCNFAMIGKTKTKIINFYGTSLSSAIPHRPDLIEIIHRCRKERTLYRITEKYSMLTTGEELVFDSHIISIDDTMVMIHANDITEIVKLKMRIAKTVYDILTHREQRTLHYMASGLSRIEISKILDCDVSVIYGIISLIKSKSGGDLKMMIEFVKSKNKID